MRRRKVPFAVIFAPERRLDLDGPFLRSQSAATGNTFDPAIDLLLVNPTARAVHVVGAYTFALDAEGVPLAVDRVGTGSDRPWLPTPGEERAFTVDFERFTGAVSRVRIVPDFREAP